MMRLVRNCLRGTTGVILALCGPVALFFPALASAQGLARHSLSVFPDDTQQIAYTNLAELRSLAIYPRLSERLVIGQFRSFLDFLRAAGMDPEKDVDETVLGWRGAAKDMTNFFGLASGRFQPERVRDFLAQRQVPFRQHQGVDLHAFGPGTDPSALFFGFLDSSLAVFGHLDDLVALLDVRAGMRHALDANSTFVGWESELEGAAPQWGILTGKAAANLAAPWLSTPGKAPANPNALAGSIDAVLYRLDWKSGLYAHLSILCQNAQAAWALAQLLSLWRDAQIASASGTPSTVLPLMSQIDVRADGSRVELTASGSPEAIDSILRLPASRAGQ